jgi:HPt (histidine-containing phosphotransfer) domain-containing protein
MEKPGQFDLTELETLSNGDTAFILKMLSTFSISVPPYIQKMKDAMAAKNFSELANIAHRLKPSFHYLGRPDLNQLLNKVENGDASASETEIITAATAFLKNSALMMVEADEYLEKLKNK